MQLPSESKEGCQSKDRPKYIGRKQETSVACHPVMSAKWQNHKAGFKNLSILKQGLLETKQSQVSIENLPQNVFVAQSNKQTQ
jgi:hypothetical protein